MSDKNIGADGAIMLAPEIAGNGALVKLDISENDIQAEGGKALAVGLTGNQVITDLNFCNTCLGKDSNFDSDMSGVIALNGVIKGMGAMTKLDARQSCLRHAALSLGPEQLQEEEQARQEEEQARHQQQEEERARQHQL